MTATAADLRAGLTEFETPSTALALAIFTADALIYATGFWMLTTLPWGWQAKLPLSILLGVVITRFFIVGHDAAHGAFTGARCLNGFIGRVAMLPSLHPYSLWQVGHNRVHHSFTNLKGLDFIWIPLSPEEFRALPCWRRTLEHFYRSPFGFGIYYLVEIWWKYLSPKGITALKDRAAVYWLDLALVGAFFTAQIIVAGRSAVTAVVIPFLVSNWLMGFIIYNHHTHPSVRFFTKRSEWRFYEGQLQGSVHVIFRGGIGAVFHQIMEHTAHHLSAKVPLYRLRAAQRYLERELGGGLVIEKWSLAGFRETLRRCQLYDYDRHAWIPFTAAMQPVIQED